MSALFKGLPPRILVIDDDVDLLMLLERQLDQAGYAVETAASIPEAEEIIPLVAPHLILIDINVNGADGRQLCWKIKNTPATSHIRVIVLSGQDFSQRRAALFGADDLLVKPVVSSYLISRIEFILHQAINERVEGPEH